MGTHAMTRPHIKLNCTILRLSLTMHWTVPLGCLFMKFSDSRHPRRPGKNSSDVNILTRARRHLRSRVPCQNGLKCLHLLALFSPRTPRLAPLISTCRWEGPFVWFGQGPSRASTKPSDTASPPPGPNCRDCSKLLPYFRGGMQGDLNAESWTEIRNGPSIGASK